MKKLLSSLALFTVVGSTAGPLANSVIGSKINQNQDQNSKNANDIVITTAIKLLIQTMNNSQTDGSISFLSTANKEEDCFSLLWKTINTQCLMEAESIAKTIPIIGKDVAILISSVTQQNIKLVNPNQFLKIGENVINLILSFKGIQTSFNMILNQIFTKFSVVAKTSVKTLSQVISLFSTDGSSLTTANTEQDAFGLLWKTINTQCIPQAISIAKKIPFIGEDVAILISSVVQKNFKLLNPNQFLKFGTNDINMSLNTCGCIGSTTSLNMKLNSVN